MNSEMFIQLAYIDPGIGSIILQVAVAGMLSAGVWFRRYLVLPFSGFFRKPSETDETTHESSSS